MNDISRRYAKDTTGSARSVVTDGPDPSEAVSLVAPTSTPYTPVIPPESLLWEVTTYLKHLIGIHTMRPLQIWDWSDPHQVVMRSSGAICWLCPHTKEP